MTSTDYSGHAVPASRQAFPVLAVLYLVSSGLVWLFCGWMYLSGQAGPLQFPPPWNWLDGLEIDPSDTEPFFWLLPVSWLKQLLCMAC